MESGKSRLPRPHKSWSSEQARRSETLHTMMPSNMIPLLWFLFSALLLVNPSPSVTGFALTRSQNGLVQRQRSYSRDSYNTGGSSTASSSRISLQMMSLKPAAIPLMDSGKALARSGEFLIDITSKLDIYGGALSAAGAQVRNAGDCVAQAAASCRFKTGAELVCDELRESADCLKEATSKLKQAILEANADENNELAKTIESMVDPMSVCGTSLESAGAGIMQHKSIADIGADFVTCGQSLETLSIQVRGIAPKVKESMESGQRMAFAADRMVDAGKELQSPPPNANKPEGKAWIKG